jgi:hypothetical protein
MPGCCRCESRQSFYSHISGSHRPRPDPTDTNRGHVIGLHMGAFSVSLPHERGSRGLQHGTARQPRSRAVRYPDFGSLYRHVDMAPHIA